MLNYCFEEFQINESNSVVSIFYKIRTSSRNKSKEFQNYIKFQDVRKE